MIIQVNKQWDKKGTFKGDSNDESVTQRSELSSPMESSLHKPQGVSKRKVIKNCGWCEKENHWLTLERWYSVDQGEDLGFYSERSGVPCGDQAVEQWDRIFI